MKKIYLKKINIPPKSRILDLGSYDGRKNKWLVKRGYNYLGLDLLVENKFVKKSDFVKWLKDNNDRFSLILAEFSLQQIPRKKIPSILENIKKSLNRNGYFLFSSFNNRDKFGPFFTQNEFIKICEGFEILSWNTYISKDIKKRNRSVTEILLKKN